MTQSSGEYTTCVGLVVTSERDKVSRGIAVAVLPL
jgi:hypothetical protein